jgi:hypothetical protein
MESVGSQINNFLDKCNEIKTCKFIMATTKIKDLLKCIVNSPELYELFTTVSTNFNYIEAKQRCLIDSSDGVVNTSHVVLPDTVGDRLAFIFCLLVEFDRDSINFNWFLQHYFAEDGSYYASYHAFCDSVIVSLESLIKDVFAQELAEENSATAEQNLGGVAQQPQPKNNPQLSTYITTINMLIEQEKMFIEGSAIPDDDKDAGCNILCEIMNAVKECDTDLINALVCGYNYYILYNNSVSATIQNLFETIRLFEEAL